MERFTKIEELAPQPPCQEACPLRQDIRGYISFIAQGQFDKALEIIKDTNPLPSICGNICAHPCEDRCRRGDVDHSLSIRALKRFAVEHGTSLPPSQTKPRGGRKVAIVGSGPAGLTAAHDLAKADYQVTIFERGAEPGGMLQTAIPLYRLPRDVIQRDIESIKTLGVEIRTSMELGKDFTLDDLERESYEAILLSLGLPLSRGLPLPGVDLNGVLLALPFLRAVNLEGYRFEPEKVVIVVGGGNVAIDAARCAIRAGAGKVRLACLEARHEMPAFPWEIEEALEEGCEINCSKGPRSVLGRDGKVAGLELMDVRAVFDAEGRFNPTFYEERISSMDGDVIIFAIGQATELSFLKDDGIELDDEGRLIFDPETQATSREGVFACGEVITGPGAAVEAMASGRKAAQSIASYLGGEGLFVPRGEEPTVVGELSASTIDRIRIQERINIPLLAPKQRLDNFDPVELGYDEADATEEARRCLNCGMAARRVKGKCCDCLTCMRICPYGVPILSAIGAIEIRIDQCQGCGLCFSECPSRAITLGPALTEELGDSISAAMREITASATEPAILGICCSYRACPSSTFAEWLVTNRPHNLGLARIPCLAKLDVACLLKPFELGAVGVLVITPPGEECRYPESVPWVKRRISSAKKILNDIGLHEGQMEMWEVQAGQALDFAHLLAEFTDNLKEVQQVQLSRRVPT